MMSAPALLLTALLLIALLLGLVWRFPALFAGRGLPPHVTGLNLGPQGWRTAHTPNWRLVLLLTLLGAILRLLALNRDLWLDEISTLTLYGRWPLLETLTTFVAANQHVFYVTLAKISLLLFGPAEWSVRLPAVLFGIASIPAFYDFARLLTREREALWGTVLLTFSYHHLWFSQNARGWTAVLFFSLVGGSLFLRGLAQNRTRTRVAYSVVMALGVFTHLNTLFIVAGHLGAYLLLFRRLPGRELLTGTQMRRLLWTGLLTAAFILLLHSFILPQMLTYYLNHSYAPDEFGWSNPLALLAVALQGLAAGFFGIGLLLVGLILLPGLYSYTRQSPLLLGMLVLPAAVNLVVVLLIGLGTQPRAFFYVLPLGLLLAVRGAFVLGDWLGRRWTRRTHLAAWPARNLAPLLLALVLVASLLSLIPYYRIPKQDYRGALAYVEAQRRPEDVIAAVGLAASGYRALYGPHLQFPQDVTELQALRGEEHATWLFLTFYRDMRLHHPALLDYIEQEFTPQAQFPGTVGDGTIHVLRADGNE